MTFLRKPPLAAGRALLAALLFGSAASALAQAGLDTLRKGFLRQVLVESQTLAEQYERALAKLEADLAAEADYEGAMQAKARREEITAIYRTGVLPAGAVALGHEQARLAGAAEVRGEELTGWRSASAQVEWQDIVLTPGSYYLDLEASVVDMPSPGVRAEPRSSVSFLFQEAAPMPEAEVNRRSFEIQSQGREGMWQPVRAGPLDLGRGPLTLRLTPQAGYPANRVSFRNLRLVPADGGVIQAPSLPEQDALQTARVALEKQLAEVLDAVLRTRGSDAKPEEKRRLAELAAVLREKGAAKLLARITRQAGGPQDLVEVDDATLVQAETATGERFSIQHGAQVTPVRLLWAEGIPQDDSAGRLRQLAARLGVDAAALPPLAATARDFTITYLQGRKLQVLMEPRPGPDGAHAALVFVPGIGLYQSVLAGQGLAFLRPGDRPPAPGLEQALRSAVEKNQQEAKKRGRGAWAAVTEVGK